MMALHETTRNHRQASLEINSSNMALAAVALQDHRLVPCPSKIHSRKEINHSLPAAAKKKSSKTTVGKSGKEDHDKKEYVLDPKPAPLTLAQKLGLVEAPELLLSDKEWKKVKEKSNARQDSSQPCVICKKTLVYNNQVFVIMQSLFFTGLVLKHLRSFLVANLAPCVEKSNIRDGLSMKVPRSTGLNVQQESRQLGVATLYGSGTKS
ncbi:RING finger protein 32 [Desmophyllum pertusum]|uniref:RING finger protein 32 n=1 Tax=Desmophyllum pertusum TaxID=174260 RepID=A0A9W9Y7H9_9CNID|nr:RING finger protein 32 [Desmophyllum pertusum]